MKITGETKLFLGIIGATIITIVIAVAVFSKPPAPPKTFAREELLPAGTTLKGNASSSAFLVEFSDYQCPACAAFEPIVEDLLKTYEGKLLFGYRHFPLEQHPLAYPAARVAEAAGLQGKYWEMHALLFENQAGLSEELFTQLADKLELDPDKFSRDRSLGTVDDKIQRDRADGVRFGIRATPTFYLNGNELILNTPDDLKQAVAKSME